MTRITDMCTSSEVKRSKVKVTRPLNAVTKNQPYLQNGIPASHHLHGGGHIVAATQHATQLVISIIMPLPLIGGGIKRCFCLTSVCLVHRA